MIERGFVLPGSHVEYLGMTPVYTNIEYAVDVPFLKMEGCLSQRVPIPEVLQLSPPTPT